MPARIGWPVSGCAPPRGAGRAAAAPCRGRPPRAACPSAARRASACRPRRAARRGRSGRRAASPAGPVSGSSPSTLTRPAGQPSGPILRRRRRRPRPRAGGCTCTPGSSSSRRTRRTCRASARAGPNRRSGRRAGSSRRVWRGKICGPSNSFSASSTSVVRSSLVPPMAAEKSRQKSRRTSFQSISWFETRSSCSSRSAVKSYST